MEPNRNPGDDREMWRVTRVLTGAYCIVETEQDAKDMAGNDELWNGEYSVTSVVVTADEWNEMPEFEGW